jgi:uncharacterized protein with ParB-like and HNH nuclease domain
MTRMPRPILEGGTANFTIQHGYDRPVRAMLMDGRVPDDCRTLGSFVLPPFQRPSVWTRVQEVRFIESIWLGLPLSCYVYNEDVDGRADRWLIDGQQRWTAIVDYVNGDFPVFGSLFSDLGPRDRRHFDNTPFPAIVTRESDERLLEELYDRLAYGGTPHERTA